ncbi:hypothetical protein GCM10028791_05210 [Echinicola sediminis]
MKNAMHSKNALIIVIEIKGLENNSYLLTASRQKEPECLAFGEIKDLCDPPSKTGGVKKGALKGKFISWILRDNMG